MVTFRVLAIYLLNNVLRGREYRDEPDMQVWVQELQVYIGAGMRLGRWFRAGLVFTLGDKQLLSSA